MSSQLYKIIGKFPIINGNKPNITIRIGINRLKTNKIIAKMPKNHRKTVNFALKPYQFFS